MTLYLALLCDVGEVVAEPAEQATVALVAQVVEADALLFAVEVHDGCQVVRILALIAATADALHTAPENCEQNVTAGAPFAVGQRSLTVKRVTAKEYAPPW